jgi:hypothetical protein
MPKIASSRPAKTQKRLGLVLDLGPSIRLTIHWPGSSKICKSHTVILDNWIANFQEALDVPHEKFLLKDFCGADFFHNKTGLTTETVYHQTQEGNIEGAELFVEYGAHMGALIANLEMIFQPSCISITGPLAKTFGAWSHAMGKTRKTHLGKRPACKITII